MKIIDFHAHIYPEKIAKKAAEFICDFYNLKEGMEGTSSLLLEQGKKAGISKYVILPVATKVDNVRSINNFVLEEQIAHSEFICFGTVHAGQENLIQEVEYIVSSGLHGIKIHPDQQGFAIDDQRLYPLYDSLQNKMPILFHCGDPKSNLSHPSRLKKILKEFPHLNVIAAHFGGWSIFEEAIPILKSESCSFDISSSLAFLSPKKAVEYIRTYGSEKMLFGTDFPMWNPVKEVERFLELPLTSCEQEQIAWQNAQRILKLS